MNRLFKFSLSIALSCALSLLHIVRAEAQIQIYQTSLIDTNKALLYSGFDNLIHIVNLPGGTTLKFLKTTEIRTSGFSGFSFYPKWKSTYSDTLIIIKGKKVLLRKGYAFDTIPNPKVVFGILKDSFGTVERIMAFPKLRIEFPGTGLKPFFLVINFSISVFHREQLIYPLMHVYGDNLMPEQLEIIRRLKPGDVVQFDDIKATCPDCRIRNFGSLRLTIR